MISIGGFQKLSLINYPGKMAACVFLNGCIFRCRFCYNTELACPPYSRSLPVEDVLADLRKCHWALDGVVISGGEPCMHPDLPEFIRPIKEMGYLIKLDTCGYFPDMLRILLDLGFVDYIAMDIKAPFRKYDELVQVKVDDRRLRDSIQIILESGIEHEFRSTLVSGAHAAEDLREMAAEISGARAYYLQPFRANAPLMDPTYSTRIAPPMDEMLRAVKDSGSKIGSCEVRG